MILNEIAVLILEAIGRLLLPWFRPQLARLAHRLLSDLPILEGHWVVGFDDPSSEGERVPTTVHVELIQFGRRVNGSGHLQCSPHDSFTFSGTIRRNVFFGSYWRDDEHVLAGTGTFVLKIIAHSRELRGHCIWYDGLLEDVWNSSYVWRRSPSGS